MHQSHVYFLLPAPPPNSVVKNRRRQPPKQVGLRRWLSTAVGQNQSREPCQEKHSGNAGRGSGRGYRCKRGRRLAAASGRGKQIFHNTQTHTRARLSMTHTRLRTHTRGLEGVTGCYSLSTPVHSRAGQSSYQPHHPGVGSGQVEGDLSRSCNKMTPPDNPPKPALTPSYPCVLIALTNQRDWWG